MATPSTEHNNVHYALMNLGARCVLYAFRMFCLITEHCSQFKNEQPNGAHAPKTDRQKQEKLFKKSKSDCNKEMSFYNPILCPTS